MAKRTPIQIYTDGACRGNPGPGGYGVVMRCGNYEKEFSAGYRLTTNNRMELLAVIIGLEAIKWSDAAVTVWSDSSYVVNAVENGSVFNWEKKNFLKKANPDLWIRFLKVYREHKVSFVWIKGHSGHPDNERCDYLAVTASMGPDLAMDEVYETSNVKNELFNNLK
ncbi:MAG TPA: ribonuclease HI [Bacteroidales bacterium]|nr:ribonuclease HI [Bacteroidales bacterium]HPK30546.1 ribonuclease HI [Bacteroidales bacterium]